MAIATLITWLFTASIGAYMLRTWIARARPTRLDRPTRPDRPDQPDQPDQPAGKNVQDRVASPRLHLPACPLQAARAHDLTQPNAIGHPVRSATVSALASPLAYLGSPSARLRSALGSPSGKPAR